MADDHAFALALREALNHLYDPDFLASSPLIGWLGLLGGEDPARALREVLEKAIEAFRPASDPASDSRQWRHYQVLLLRYVQQMTQDGVALQLGVTARHVRREQSAALQALEQYLRLQYDLDAAPSGAAHEIALGGQSNAELNREMLWLADSQHDRASEVSFVLGEAWSLVQSLARSRSVEVELRCDRDLPLAAVPRTVLRQIVLNLLTAVMGNLAPGGTMHLQARASGEDILVSISASAAARPWREVQALEAAAHMSRRLAELFGSEVVLYEIEEALVIQVELAIWEQQAMVLAIEDNTDTLQLWKRYVQRTRFCLATETDPAQALARASALRPDLIILDVMLPGIDGWDLLGQLRAHPDTRHIPVIVCTVLPQEELARSLGASGFIQKPVTGRAFRSELERQIAAAARP